MKELEMTASMMETYNIVRLITASHAEIYELSIKTDGHLDSSYLGLNNWADRERMSEYRPDLLIMQTPRI